MLVADEAGVGTGTVVVGGLEVEAGEQEQRQEVKEQGEQEIEKKQEQGESS